GWVVLQTRAYLVAVHARLSHVHQYQVGQLVLDVPQMRPQIQLPFVHGVAVFRQDSEELVEARGGVVNDENAALVLALVGRGHEDLQINECVTRFTMMNEVGTMLASNRRQRAPMMRRGSVPKATASWHSLPLHRQYARKVLCDRVPSVSGVGRAVHLTARG